MVLPMEVMAKLVARVMLFLCIWNIAATALSDFAAAFAEGGISRCVSQSQDPCCTEIGTAKADSADDDRGCDPTNCENEECKSHQCHFGHCTFVVKDVAGATISPPSVSILATADWTAQSVSLASLIRPPIF